MTQVIPRLFISPRSRMMTSSVMGPSQPHHKVTPYSEGGLRNLSTASPTDASQYSCGNDRAMERIHAKEIKSKTYNCLLRNIIESFRFFFNYYYSESFLPNILFTRRHRANGVITELIFRNQILP